ncbi:hypothetical protein PoB_000313900 [Plakobranchus ocellatus]|uniref:Uncharacterized protein n=1 Tax=Plakobranchus ocellatus TaxID=259542 RepID=A0AAV3Y108_9GAST|nr:hypothetical protein PoB_000313900 [Plakobranchus ocellatus]
MGRRWTLTGAAHGSGHPVVMYACQRWGLNYQSSNFSMISYGNSASPLTYCAGYIVPQIKLRCPAIPFITNHKYCIATGLFLVLLKRSSSSSSDGSRQAVLGRRSNGVGSLSVIDIFVSGDESSTHDRQALVW